MSTICPKCGRNTKREFGILTIIGVVVTGGAWLLALPFYPKKCASCNDSFPQSITSNNCCQKCGSKLIQIPGTDGLKCLKCGDISSTGGFECERARKEAYKIRSLVALFVILFIGFKLMPDPPPEPPRTAEQIAQSQEEMDGIDARSWAMIFVKQALKAPTSAKFPSTLDFAFGPEKDKKGKTIKGLWAVSSYVDSQNSFGAMLRSNWYVKVKKVDDRWVLLDIKIW